MQPRVSRLGLAPAPPGTTDPTTEPTPSNAGPKPGPQATCDLPARASRATDDFHLPPPGLPARPTPPAGQVAIRPREVSQWRARVEAHLLGPQKLQHLRQQFGRAEPPRARNVWDAIKPWERGRGHPIVHPQRLLVPAEGGRRVDLATMLDLEGLKAGSVKYLYVVTQVGALIVAKDLPAPGIAGRGGRMPHLGHPTLTGGGPGRIAGELRYDREKDELFINDNSGRYSLNYRDRGPTQLENVAERFRAAGLAVGVRHGGDTRHWPRPVR